MDKILYFDICAMVIYLILLLAIVMRGMTKSKLNRYFVYIIVDCIIATVADIIAIYFDNMRMGSIVGRYACHTIYLIAHILSTPLYLMYVVSLTDTWHIYKKKRFFFLASLPFSATVLLLLENLFVHNVFYIDEVGSYVRGQLFFVLYLSAIFYFILGIFLLIRHRKMFGKKQMVSLVSVFPIMLSAIIIQFFMPHVTMEMFANAISLLFLLMMVQSGEDFVDGLTGLGNMNKYVQDVRNAFSNKKQMHIIMVNVLNDTFVREVAGYDAFRQMMRTQIGKMLEICKKGSVYAECYYLGDGKIRFVLEEKYFQKTMIIARKMNDEWKKDILIGEMNLNVTACVCVAKCPEDISDVEALLRFGKDFAGNETNGEVLCAANIFQKNQYDLMRNIDVIIEQAISAHKFEVYYQPIYSVKEQRFKSAEALLRLRDDVFGFISPEIFITAAEKSGAIHRIGNYVLHEVCSFIASEEFQSLGVDYIEVNLSVVQGMRANLAQEVLDIMRKYDVRPSQLNLEITETAASYSQNTLMDNIEVLTNEGVYFSLDDYGTGYSNMCRIATMPFKLVKLDKSFANLEDQKFKIVLQNTIQMIKDLQMEIVVEGIETKELVEQFSDLSCEYIQGYYFSKPLPKQEFITFVKHNNA